MLEYNFKESLGKLSQEVSKGMGQLIEKNFNKNNINVSSREWVVLTYIANKPKVSQSDLVIPLGKDKVAVKRLIDSMEAKKWVKRQSTPDDKRFNIIILTKEGLNIYKKIKPIVEESMQHALAEIPKESLQICMEVLNKVDTNIKTHLLS